jgi:hypothetical protein
MSNADLRALVLEQQDQLEKGREELEKHKKELEILRLPNSSLVKLNEENLYLREAVSIHQFLLPVQNLSWRSK